MRKISELSTATKTAQREDRIKINGVTYEVIRTRAFEHNGNKREALFLRRPNGRRVYQAVRYETGDLSSVVLT